MTSNLLSVPDQIIERLNPAISKLVFDLGGKYVEFGENWTRFKIEGLEVTIEIKG